MGGEKQTQQSQQQTKTEYTASPEERQMISGQMDLFNQNKGALGDVQKNSLGLINLLLQGQGLPGYLNQLPGGISGDVTDSIVNQSLKDIAPQFQSAGILDSGTAAQISSRNASDIRTNAAQFNLQNLMQLLNLAVGGQAQVQAPIMQQTSMLGSQLAGLRSVNQIGSSSQTTMGMNPFVKSFQQSAGKTLGSPQFSAGPFSFYGGG